MVTRGYCSHSPIEQPADNEPGELTDVTDANHAPPPADAHPRTSATAVCP